MADTQPSDQPGSVPTPEADPLDPEVRTGSALDALADGEMAAEGAEGAEQPDPPADLDPQ